MRSRNVNWTASLVYGGRLDSRLYETSSFLQLIHLSRILTSLSALCYPFKDEAQTALTLRRLMSYTYGAPILDVSRSHTTTQYSR